MLEEWDEVSEELEDPRMGNARRHALARVLVIGTRAGSRAPVLREVGESRRK